MNEKQFKVWYTVIGLICGILFILNKEIFRPKYGQLEYLSVILGSLPNFLGGFIFSIALIPQLLKRKVKNKRLLGYLYVGFVFSFLAIEEYYPYFTASKTTDVFDIIASGIASVFAIFIYEYAFSVFGKEERIEAQAVKWF